MSIDVNVQNDLVIVTESSEDIVVNVSNAAGPAGPAGVGVPVGGSTGQVLKKLSATNYDTYWALDGGGVPYTGATGDVDLGEYELKAGQVEFDQTPTGAIGAAVMRWNDSDGTVDLGLKGGNVTLQVGQEQVIRVVNKTGANLLESQYRAVRIRLVSEGGSQGQRLAVVLAQGDNDPDSTTTIGIVTENIDNNQEGFITTSGEVRGINTTGSLQGETWVDGDIIYLSPTIPGGITKVKPTAPQHLLQLGYVIYAHNVNGKIFVKIDNGYELSELHDVFAPSPTDGQGIFWNTANLRYQNNTVAGILGYTPVPTTRTLTINGTAYDLSADRSWTVSASATPAGSNTQLQYNNSGVFGASAGLTFNASTSILTIGDGTNDGVKISTRLDSGSGGTLYQYTTSNTRYSTTSFFNSSNQLAASFGYGDSLVTETGLRDAFILGARTVGGKTLFVGGAAANVLMTLTAAGRLLLGTTSESTYLLDVNGTARVSGDLTILNNKLVVENTSNNTAPTMMSFINIGSGGGTGATFQFSYSSTMALTYGSGFTFTHNGTATPTRITSSGVFTGGSLIAATNLLFDQSLPATIKSNGQGTDAFTYIGGGSLLFQNYNSTYDTRFAILQGTGNVVIQNGGTFTDIASARLQVNSITQGFLPPRMTTTEKNAIATPATGLQVYDTVLGSLNVYNGTSWVALGAGGGGSVDELQVALLSQVYG